MNTTTSFLFIFCISILTNCKSTNFSSESKKNKQNKTTSTEVPQPKIEEPKELPKIEEPKELPKIDNNLQTKVEPEVTEPQPPKDNCRTHFSGVALIDKQFDSYSNTFSEIYVIDNSSEFVGAGKYPKNTDAFPKAVAQSFDSIAIDEGTTVTIYSQPNFQGEILFKKTGPAIIYNIKFETFRKHLTATFKEPLQSEYPPHTRFISETDMNPWSFGSSIIECR